MDKKIHIILYILIITLLSNFAYADLTTNLAGYWSFDNATATDISDDSGNEQHGTATAGTVASDSNCIIGSCLDFDDGGTNDVYSIPDDGSVLDLGTDDFCISFWVKLTDKSSNKNFIAKQNIAGEDGNDAGYYPGQFDTNGYPDFGTNDVSGNYESSEHQVDFLNTLHHVINCYDRSAGVPGKQFFVDNVNVTNSLSHGGSDSSGSLSNANPLIFGAYRDTTTNPADGYLDEVGIWKRLLTLAEIGELYNSGVGCNPVENPSGCEVSTPTIFLTSPADNNISEVTSNNFLFNLTYYGGSYKCSLSTNESGTWTEEETTSSINNGTDTTIIHAFSKNGNYIWNVNCSNGTGQYSGTVNRTITINVSEPPIPAPTVNLYLPENNSIFNTYSHDLYFNASTIYTLTNISLYINGEYNKSNTTAVTNNGNSSFFNITFSEGTHYWGIRADDNNSNTTLSANFTIIIDTIIPEINQTGLESYIVLNDETTNSVYWEILASDPNLDDCWYWTSDNTTSQTVTCNTTINTTLTGTGNKTFHYCANDTIDNLICGITSIFAYNLNYTTNETNSIVASGDSTTFYLYLNMSDIGIDWQQTNATLQIEGTEYAPSKATTSNQIYFYYTKTWGLTDGNVTGKENYFNWTVYLKNSTSILTNFTTERNNITVYALDLDDCTTYSDMILNYSIYDETTKNPDILVNESIELDLTINAGNISWNFNLTKVNDTLAVCVPAGSLNTSSLAYLDGIAKYSAYTHTVEYHYLDNYPISTEYPIAIKLYTLNTDTTEDEYSTSFIVRYSDENYLPVDGAIIDLLRYYVGEGEYTSVEHGRTDSDGETRLHFVSEDIIYKIIIRLDNTIIFQSSEFYALCKTTPCQMEFFEEGSFNQIGNYTQNDNINYLFGLNEDTRTVVVDFSTRDGTVRTLGINVTKFDAYENETVCEDFLSASSGALSCAVPYSAKNTTYLINFFDNTTTVEWIASGWFSLDTTPEEVFGNTGIIMTFILILSLVLMGLPSGAIPTIIGLIVGVIFAVFLHIFYTGSIFGTGSAIMWLIIACAIVVWKASKREF